MKNDLRSSHFYFLKYDETDTMENKSTPIENINIWVKYFKYFSKPLLGHEDAIFRAMRS